FTPRLTRLPNGLQVDKGCYKALERMLEDCRAAGFQPVVCSAYRGREGQQALFEEKVQELMGQGQSREEAEDLAARTVARPGTSEHELGLAVDLVDLDYQLLDKEQENTPTQRWLMANAWRYGFILRYPPDTRELTGYDYEPWHYRYVGDAPAEQIHLLGLTLEDYLAMVFSDTAEIVFES
ncbi:MAG: M15 family metallopeptidase, partial [Oscillospiraceae bacterium]|nr:M15 family metallopeptidase [Oscillospiraceae bacterium]